MTLTTAPGDLAGETLGVTGGPLRPDLANGVTFTSSGSLSSSNNAIVISEYGDYIFGIQAYDPNGAAIGANLDANDASGNCWGCSVSNIIAQSGGAASVTVALGNGDISNSLLIYTGTASYGSAYLSRFPANLNNDIFIGPGASACPTCIGRQLEKPEYPTNQGRFYGILSDNNSNNSLSNYQNTWMSGFADPLFYLTYTNDGGLVPKFGPVTGSNNATDTPSSYVPKNFPIPPGGGPYINHYDGGDTF